jgi:hypothetical protein
VSELNERIGTEATNGISRRTVTKAIAWVAPVIAVSAAVPAYAASQINFNLNGLGCKLPGNSNGIFKGYAFALTVTNSSTVTIKVDIKEITLNGEDLGDVGLVDLTATPATFDDNPFTLSVGESFPDAALITQNAASSSNGTLVITYTINDGEEITVSALVNAAPPINGNSCQTFTPIEKGKLSVLDGLPRVWAQFTQYLEGDTIRLSTGEVLVAEIAGTSGELQPLAPLPGATVVDGSVTWRRPSLVTP